MIDDLRPVSRAMWLAVAAGSFAMLGADCLGNVVQDPTFRDWCGNTLCSWTLDQGHIDRVPTWSRYDFGVSFADKGAEISQVTQEHEATCLLFTSVADIDPAAQMVLLVDFDNDGTIDSEQPLASAHWHSVQTEISAPSLYQGIAFHLRKNGTGAAVLAELRVESIGGCTAPSVLKPLVLGDPCASDVQPCPTNLFCAPQTDSGTQVCSQCDMGTTCSNGAVCRARGLGMPAQCGPGQSLGAAGDPCVSGDDCSSAMCDGASVSDCSGPETSCAADAAPDVDSACTCAMVRGGACR